ncbi:MAG TPA: Plug domain-containing protein, partial [Sphingobacteriaceae bacterium]
MKSYRNSITTLLFILFSVQIFAQTLPDTSKQLNEVIIRAHFSDQPLLKSTSSIGILNPTLLQKQPEQSLVPAFNSIPGIRMEERSPGSYRLSIRGSLLRSPFGIRNIKMYLDEYALTDAGGNTYLNLLDASTLNGITILKGPEASIFGANTGGVVLIDPHKTRDSSLISAGITAGSYGLFHQKVSVKKQWKKYEFNFNQAYQGSDGYRENSALKRNYANLSQKWQYAKKSQLRSTILFSDLDYETPGGLTKAQAEKDPRMARTATAMFPGAVDQQAGIQN